MPMKYMMLIASVLLLVAYANAQTTPVPILKQINRVNDDGSYTYGFEAADGTFKVETRDNLGNVRGKYGYIDETGELKTIEYAAGQGFEASGSHIPVADVPGAASLPAAQPVVAHPRRPVPRPAPRPVPVPTTSRPVRVEQPAPVHVPARQLPTPSLSVPSFANVRQQQAVPQHVNTIDHNAHRGFSFSIEAPVFHPTTTTPHPFF
ncbi:endocuticle structural glycoprotein SgAbd-2-like [Daphnia carinata]|uniref:endocuticle structural glycoprotein SgAbd-2-like n=1 Tax=Daphnia carinata TaxID=120202 RepID=UPI002580AA6D|nr:endocuticle structural glycoprotein SgAbd-2-like [Daphnia carinata]